MDVQTAPQARDSQTGRFNVDHLIALALIFLGIGTAASSILGPLALGFIDWRISENTENQILGGDIVGLLLVAPAAIAAGVLWWRGHRLAPVLALAPAIYGLYTWPQYILAPDYLLYDGNNERAFPLYVIMITLSWVIVAVAWSRLPAREVPPVSRGLRRGITAAMLLLGGLFALTWAQQIGAVLSGDAPVEYEEGPTLFWLIKMMDLAFIIPLLAATGIGLLRNSSLAIKAAYGLAGFIVLLTGAVSAMGIVMLVQDDPSATVVLPAVTTPITFVLAWLTYRLYRPYLSTREAPPAEAAGNRNQLHQLRPTTKPESG